MRGRGGCKDADHAHWRAEQSVVMLSLDDYNALAETAYLLRNPTNAKRLLSAIGQLNAGKGIERELAA